MKEKEIRLKVSLSELESLDEFVTCLTICKKHSLQSLALSYDDLVAAQGVCPDCQREIYSLRKKVLPLVYKLFKSYGD